jgi:threonine dehydrogenase-like Zn-dependent dehydrogenase
MGGAYDHVKQILRLETDRPNALRQVIQACRPGGTVSIPGVYTGFVDKFPMGLAFGKGLTLKMGQTHTQRYAKDLLDLIARGKLDPAYIITHRMNLAEAPQGYAIFNDKEEECLKVVLKP